MTRAIPLTRTRLRRLPLPPLDDDGDKESRGRVLVVGGSTLVPGAVLLAGVAALRAGAGKLQLATVRDVAIPLALAVPEALVAPLPRTRGGEIAGARAAAPLRRYAGEAAALLVGPGMTVGPSVRALVAALVRQAGPETTVVLDGAAIVALRDDPRLLAPLGGRAVLTPHAGEMASLLDVDKRDVEGDPAAVAAHAAARFGAVVALKGAESWVAEPGAAGRLLHYRAGRVGLGTSGSGDTLAGIVAGLAALGAPPLVAAAWGVWAHGTAGQVLARRMGEVGFLARELLDEVPALVGRR